MNQAIIELTAPDISCEKCKANIEGHLASHPGIDQVAVDVGTRRVRITYYQDRTSPDQLRAKLSDIGYTATPSQAPTPTAGHPGRAVGAGNRPYGSGAARNRG